MAKQADQYAMIRSCYHTAAAVHDTGHQMMQTGRLFQGGVEYPHIGCVLSKLKGPNGDVPAHVLLPKPIGNTGGNMPHGQNAGFLGKMYDPFVLNADPSDPNFKVPDHAAARLPHRAAGRPPAELAGDGGSRRSASSKRRRMRDCSIPRSIQAYTLMSSEKARAAFELDKRAGRTRGSATGRIASGRAACWRGA